MDTLAFNTRLPVELKQKLDDLSEREGTSIKVIVERALEAYLNPNNGPLTRRLGTLDPDEYNDYGLAVITHLVANNALRFVVVDAGDQKLYDAKCKRAMLVDDSRIGLVVEAPAIASAAPLELGMEEVAPSPSNREKRGPRRNSAHIRLHRFHVPSERTGDFERRAKAHKGSATLLGKATDIEPGKSVYVYTASLPHEQAELFLTAVKEDLGLEPRTDHHRASKEKR